MNYIPSALDTYGRNAWLRPALIISLPITSLAIVIFVTGPPWWAGMSSIICSSGIIYYAADIVQSLGKAKENHLWSKWGAAPTTLLLSYLQNPNTDQVDRYHDKLKQIDSSLKIPTIRQEQKHPEESLNAYVTATKFLISKTNNHTDFPMVFMQNYRYGFRRNLWASKRLCIFSSVISILLILLFSALNIWSYTNISWAGLLFVASLDVILLITMLTVVNENWVHQVAEAYANRLLEALEIL